MYDALDGRRPNFSAAHVRLFKQLEHDDIAGGVAVFVAVDAGDVGYWAVPLVPVD